MILLSMPLQPNYLEQKYGHENIQRKYLKVMPSSSKKVAFGLSELNKSSRGSLEVMKTKVSSSKRGLILCNISFKLVLPGILSDRQYYIFLVCSSYKVREL